MKKELLLFFIILFSPMASFCESPVLLKEFSDSSLEQVGSSILASGPAEPALNERVEYVVEIQIARPPSRSYRPGYISSGIIEFLVPQTSLSCGGGIYIFYDDIQLEYYDTGARRWRPVAEETDPNAEFLTTLPFRALPFGLGAVAGYLMDREKESPERTLTKEEYRNYYKNILEGWSGKYERVRVTLPMERRGELTEKEKFGLRVHYEEASAMDSGTIDIRERNPKSGRQIKNQREFQVEDLLEVLTVKEID